MPTLLSNISQADIERLKYERFAYPHPMIQKRIFAVYLKAVSDYPNRQISFIVGLHANTVAHWCGVYESQGYEALLTNNYGTNISKLQPYSPGILDAFDQQPPRSAAEAASRIRLMTGIKRSTQQVRMFMKRHGLSFLKCGHIPAKADAGQQKHWMATRLKPAIQAAREGKAHLLFLDAAHFMLAPFVCYLWCRCRLFVRAASGRNRINVLGAVDAITRKVFTLTNTTYITAETVMDFLRMLRSKYDDKPLVIVLDNARYQHCEAVLSLARLLGIKLLFLPPYSPNLNIMERTWKLAKKQILHARYYDTPEVFHRTVSDFFAKINRNCKKELQTLLTLRFQFFDQKKSQIYPL